MSIVSNSDLWMYVSSTGALTAGRKNEDAALFPYETDDRLHLAAGTTGPFTLLRVTIDDDEPVLWQPFADSFLPSAIQRNLYKSVLGNQVIFEETHRQLGLRFRYRWRNSDEFGFIRTCSIESDRTSRTRVALLDGLLNVLPAGAELVIQQRASCLINAYSQCESDGALGIYAMTSLITDKAEAADSLRANIIWSRGISQASILLCEEQTPAFAAGKELTTETITKGRRGAYLISGDITIEPGSGHRWDIVADAGRDQFAVERIRCLIGHSQETLQDLEQSIGRATRSLTHNLASADALQLTADRMASHHHLANVLFNNMRGGVPANNGLVSADDLSAFIKQRNITVAPLLASLTSDQPAVQAISAWIKRATSLGNTDLIRLCYEYLPITFSRRHGDPSRPWNRFSILVQDEQGNPILNYQGNWRDIFQNWEAMCVSFPDYIESIIAKFVNASTLDGFNPYRITREGIDWETPDPHDPWAHIGYWGDHQIIYLLRLLELSNRCHGGRLTKLLDEPIFSYANVPYRIKPYQQLLVDHTNTIDFDRPLDQAIQKRVAQIGGDAKLVTDGSGNVLHATLLEKLVVPLLSKLSNLIVDDGIWMNTQRPEWNDANNALVGNGVSMVTLCYLRRYVAFLQNLLAPRQRDSAELSQPIAEWLKRVSNTLQQHQASLSRPSIGDQLRKTILDELGEAFSDYRHSIYQSAPAGKSIVSRSELDALLSSSLKYLDHSIRANRRSNGLYHAYNLLTLATSGDGVGVDHLAEMLEGQVAVLSSGTLGAAEAAATLDAMFASKLYRPDQHSFMLYPNRDLPQYLQRNIVPEESVLANPLLAEMIKVGDRSIIARDPAGHYRFTSSPKNAGSLKATLDSLESSDRWPALVKSHRVAVLDLYESIVNHRAFTGRSGTMYSYEGLGCIYWHMVSKLLLAVQECYFNARMQKAPAPATRALAELYYKIRQGLSFNKTTDEYGAVPLDPYSHTPAHRGAQQPGMTGQVKEEILTRFGELGVSVQAGVISFTPILLRRSEFLSAPTVWSFTDLTGRDHELTLTAKSLGFTLCQTPVIFTLGEEAEITVRHRDGRPETIAGSSLPPTMSDSILRRTGELARIEVVIPASSLLNE
jgi:hypothetical protein